jgi:hypothetical protein
VNPLRPIFCDTQLGLLPPVADFIATRSWICFQLRPIDCDTQLGLLPTAFDFMRLAVRCDPTASD